MNANLTSYDVSPRHHDPQATSFDVIRKQSIHSSSTGRSLRWVFLLSYFYRFCGPDTISLLCFATDLPLQPFCTIVLRLLLPSQFLLLFYRWTEEWVVVPKIWNSLGTSFHCSANVSGLILNTHQWMGCESCKEFNCKFVKFVLLFVLYFMFFSCAQSVVHCARIRDARLRQIHALIRRESAYSSRYTRTSDARTHRV